MRSVLLLTVKWNANPMIFRKHTYRAHDHTAHTQFETSKAFLRTYTVKPAEPRKKIDKYSTNHNILASFFPLVLLHLAHSVWFLVFFFSLYWTLKRSMALFCDFTVFIHSVAIICLTVVREQFSNLEVCVCAKLSNNEPISNLSTNACYCFIDSLGLAATHKINIQK